MNKTTAIKRVKDSIYTWVEEFIGYCASDYDNENDNDIKEFIVSWLKSTPTQNSTNDMVFNVACSKFDGDLDSGDYINSDGSQKNKNQTFIRDISKKLLGIHKEYLLNNDKVTTKKVVSGVKKIGKKVLVRKVARKIVNQTQGIAIDWLVGPDALNDPSLKSKIAAFLSTDFGKALFSVGIGFALDLLPTDKLPFGGESIAGVLSEISEELKVQATDQATIPLENAAMLLLPMFKENIMPLIAAASASDVKKLNQ